MNSLHKKICCVVIMLAVSLELVSCNNEDNTSFIDLTDEDEINSFNYTETEDIADSLVMETLELELNNDTSVVQFTVSDSVMYYVLEIYLESSSDYYHEIRAYDIVSGEDSLLYTSEDVSVVIENILCNSRYLTWIEYDVSSNVYSLKYIDLNNNTQPKEIFAKTMNSDNLFPTTISITNGALYWFGEVGDDEDCYELWSYNFEDAKINNNVNDITTYFSNSINIINGCFMTYENENKNEMYMHYLSSNICTCIEAPNKVNDPVTNGEYVAWGSYATDISLMNYDLYIYDMYRKTLELIDIPYYESYGFLDNYLVVNEGNKIVCYDIQNKQYCTVFAMDTYSIYYTNQGLSNIYAQFYSEEDLETYEDSSVFKLINIKQVSN